MGLMLELDDAEVVALRRLLDLVRQNRGEEMEADPTQVISSLTSDEIGRLIGIAAAFDFHARQGDF